MFLESLVGGAKRMLCAKVRHRSFQAPGLAAPADFCALGKWSQLMHPVRPQPDFRDADLPEGAEPTQRAFFEPRLWMLLFAVLNRPLLRTVRPLGNGRIAEFASGFDDERLDVVRRAQRGIRPAVRGDMEDGFELLQKFRLALKPVHECFESAAR